MAGLVGGLAGRNYGSVTQAIAIGDVISFYGEIIKTGKTSITIDVQVYSTHQPQLAEAHTVKVTEAILTYVALHQDGSKRELPEH